MKTILILLALFAAATIIVTIFFLILCVIAWASNKCEDLEEMSDDLDRRG